MTQYNLSGVIRHLGVPVAGVGVFLQESSPANRRPGKTIAGQVTDTGGEFQFAAARGSFCLEIVPDRNTRYLPQIISGIDVLANTAINVSLSTGFILNGTVGIAGDASLENCRVTAVSTGAPEFQATAALNESGEFSLLLARGKYQLIPTWLKTDASGETMEPDIPSPASGHLIVAVHQDMSVKALVLDKGVLIPAENRVEDRLTDLKAGILDSAAQELELKAHLGLKVRFDIAGQDGKPAARCRMEWRPYGKQPSGRRPGDAHGITASTEGVAFAGEDGCIELVLLPAIYTFCFEPEEGGNYAPREIKQLSIIADTTRAVKLPFKHQAADTQLTLDFSPDTAAD